MTYANHKTHVCSSAEKVSKEHNHNKDNTIRTTAR